MLFVNQYTVGLGWKENNNTGRNASFLYTIGVPVPRIILYCHVAQQHTCIAKVRQPYKISAYHHTRPQLRQIMNVFFFNFLKTEPRCSFPFNALCNSSSRLYSNVLYTAPYHHIQFACANDIKLWYFILYNLKPDTKFVSNPIRLHERITVPLLGKNLQQSYPFIRIKPISQTHIETFQKLLSIKKNTLNQQFSFICF